MAIDCNLSDPKVQPALEKWAVKCGFSWELIPEEPWHIRWIMGDKVPQAVLDYERLDDMSAETENQVLQIYNAIFKGGNSCGTVPPGFTTNSIVNKLDYLIAKAQAGVPVNVDEAAIAAEVAKQLAPIIPQGGTWSTH